MNAELKNYMGTTPVPNDFDEFWDRSIQEMRSVDPKAEFTEAEFKYPNVDCYDLYFTGVKGARVYAKHMRPKNIEGKAPAVLVFHGYTASSPDWTEMMHFVLAGFSVFALDCRGQGGKSIDVGGVIGDTYIGHMIRGVDDVTPDKLLFRDIFLDTAELAEIAMNCDYVDETRVYAHGGSQGGGLTLACAALEPRIKKLSAVYPFLCDYQKQYELNGDAFGEFVHYFRKHDPRHERETEFFTRLGYIDVKNLVRRIKAKSLVFTGMCDTAVPPAGQFAAFNNMVCERKHIIYNDFGHEGLTGANDITMQFFINE